MAYKTFEDMKHDIPEGATHYSNEDREDYFGWYKSDGGINYVWAAGRSGCWLPLDFQGKMHLDKVKPIPQIETPEEKEALDMIDITSKQVESLANDSELPNGSGWSNGDECVYMTHNVVHQFIGPCPKREGYGYIQAPTFEVNFVELSKLSKPESPEQKAERERLDLVKKACLTVRHDYGLMSESDMKLLEKAGLEWLKAFEKEDLRLKDS